MNIAEMSAEGQVRYGSIQEKLGAATANHLPPLIQTDF